jgi:hypothetical protein
MDNLSLVFAFKIASDIDDSNYIDLKFHQLDLLCWLIMQHEKSVHTYCHGTTHTHTTQPAHVNEHFETRKLRLTRPPSF